MKTAAIILFIIYVISKIISMCVENYIKNDQTESIRYKMFKGATTLGGIYGIFKMISVITFASDVVLIFIMLIDKL